jgi:hypothetical protein
MNSTTRRLVYMATVLVVCGCVQPQGQTQQSASAQPPPPPTQMSRSAFSGIRQQVGYYTERNPDCSSAGMPVVRTDVLPTHGTVVTAEGEGYTNYPQTNQRYACNATKARLIQVFYTSVPGYRGSDEFVIHAIFPSGVARTDRYTINVE